MNADDFMPVARAIAAHLATLPPASDAARAHLCRSARAARPRAGFAPAPGPDYAAILQPALAAARAHEAAVIADAVAALPVALPWHYHYAPRSDAEDLADRVAFAELIGPAAPLAAPDCRVGFTLMAPGTLYPMHAHPAVELYLVIAGHAQWTTPESDRIVPPGGFVLHQSDQPHAMRTHAEPLLALYAWQGNIDAPARYI
jgi:quercetin dioxygenase-like cupin family protein